MGTGGLLLLLLQSCCSRVRTAGSGGAGGGLKEPLCRGGGLGGCHGRGLESWRGAEKVLNSIELVSASWSCGSAGEHRPEPGTKAEPPRSRGGGLNPQPPGEELELGSVAEPCPCPGDGALGKPGVLEAAFGAEPHVSRGDKSCRQRQVRVCRWFRGSLVPGSRPAVPSDVLSASKCLVTPSPGCDALTGCPRPPVALPGLVPASPGHGA